MKETVEELRAKLESLQARYDALFAELAPKAQDGSGRAKFSEGSVAAWLGVSTDCLRGMIVTHLDNFAVGGEECTFALLDVGDILSLLECKSTRAAEIDFIQGQLAAVGKYLTDLDDET